MKEVRKIEEQLERYSFSRLSQFDSCLAAYAFQYFSDQPKESNCYSDFGTLAHDLLFEWASGLLEIYDLLTEYENRYDDIVVHDFPRLRNGLTSADKYYDEGYNFFANFDGVGSEYEIVSAEEEFEIQIQDFIFNGKIDLILKNKDGNYIVWDWKSKDGFKDDDEEFAYRRQLYLYSLHIKNKYNVYPTKTVFFCFRQQTQYAKPFDTEEFDEAVGWMTDTVDKIRKTFYCQYDYYKCNNICNFRHSCFLKRNVESNKALKDFIKKENKKPKIEVNISE